MDLKNRLFPYPILSPNTNDYRDAVFNTEINHEIIDDDVIFKYEILLNNKGIIDLIDSECASVSFLIECPITSFRELYNTNVYSGQFLINSNKVSNFLTITVYIIANKTIDDYKNETFNDIYNKLSFRIQAHGLLGIGDSFKIPIIKDYDEIKSVTSIFSVIPDHESSNNLVTRDLFSSGKKIIIKLPKEQFDNYKVISKDPRNNPIIHSMIIIPILVEIFTLLKLTEEWDDYEINAWFFSLEKAFEKRSLTFNQELLEIYDPYHLAQLILDAPIINGIDKLLKISILGEDFVHES